MLYQFFVWVGSLTAGSCVIYLIPGAIDWPHIWVLVVTQIALLALLTFLHAAMVLSPSHAGVLLAASTLVSWFMEAHGIDNGAVFGSRYWYAAYLGPKLPGQVPLIIPMCWFGLSYMALVFNQGIFRYLKAFGFVRPTRNVLWRAALCSYSLCAMDLIVDPTGTALGALVWENPGFYYTTPLINFAGWFVTGLIIFFAYFWFDCLHPPRPLMPPLRVADFQQLACFLSIVLLALPTIVVILLGRHWAALLFLTAFSPLLAGWHWRRAEIAQVVNVN